MKCCVCGSCNVKRIINYENMAAMQSQLYKDIKEAQICPVGEIHIDVCSNCGAISNGSFKDELVQYSEEYDNSQDSSPVFMKHKNDVISYLFSYVEKPEAIMEIGCGKGRFLKSVAEQTQAICYGYDPAYQGETVLLNGMLNIKKKYYDGSDGKKFDVIILRHVIEHIKNPVHMFASVAEALSDNGILYLETPSLEWILKNHVIFDFTYEHCSYFTIETLKHLLNIENLYVVHSCFTFSGQYISLIARKKTGSDTEIQPIGESIIRPLMQELRSFEEKKKSLLNAVRSFLQNERGRGNICFWGAAGKGVVCCNIFDQKRELVDCVVDINPNKQGGYIPMTAHKIIAPEQLSEYKIKAIFVINANYYTEVKELAECLCSEIKVYDFEKMMKEVSV